MTFFQISLQIKNIVVVVTCLKKQLNRFEITLPSNSKSDSDHPLTTVVLQIHLKF